MTVDQLDALLHGGAALLGLALLAVARRGGARRRRLALGLALAVGLLAFPGYDRLRGENFLHGPELVHYALGAKYFPELGYTGLYDAITAVSRSEGLGDPPYVRDLARGGVNGADVAGARGEARLARMRPARRESFKADVISLEATSSGALHAAVGDHGFNATPPWIAIAHAAIGDRALTDDVLVALASLDVVLLFLALLALLATYGLERTAVALVCFGAAYPFRFAWNGGSLLRYDWLVALAFALVAARRERPTFAGAALAYALAMRLFPALLVVGTGASLLARARDRTGRAALGRFALGFAAALVFLGALGASTSRGAGAYAEFAARIRAHESIWASNHIGLETVVVADTILHAEHAARGREVDFEEYRRPVQTARRRRKPLSRLLLLAAVGWVAWVARKLPLDHALALGVVLVYAAGTVSGYYFAVTLLVPFVAPRRTAVGLTVVGLLGAVLDGYLEEMTLGHVALSYGYLAVFLDWLVTAGSGASARGAPEVADGAEPMDATNERPMLP